MRNEFTAVVERARRWHIAYCPEIPGANGQGRTKAASRRTCLGEAREGYHRVKPATCFGISDSMGAT
jgi:hypothetical protein